MVSGLPPLQILIELPELLTCLVLPGCLYISGCSGMVYPRNSSFSKNCCLSFGSSAIFPHFLQRRAHLMIFLIMLSVILLSMLMIIWEKVIGLLICGITWLLNLNLTYKMLWTGVESSFLTSVLGKVKLLLFLIQILLVHYQHLMCKLSTFDV